MNTAGYILIFVGALLVRQVVTGRAQDTPADLMNLATAFFSGDVEGMKTVLAQRGENVDVDSSSGEVATGGESTSTPSGMTGFAQAVMDHGSKASNGYVLGATGPNSYDCSGLIWRTAKDMGIFTGARFTTHNFAKIRKPWVQVSSPVAGDVVLWTGKHMGVSLGGDSMYSARSAKKGIGTSSVSGDSAYFGVSPTYWRLQQGPYFPGGES